MDDTCTLPAPDPDAALFVAEHNALDFLNTVAAPDGVALDWISDGDALCAWLKLSGLLGRDELARVRRQFDAADVDMAAGQARALREWLRDVVLRKKGRGVGFDLSPLEGILAQDWSRPVLAPDGWFRHREFRSATAILGPLAETIGDLVVRADFDRVRQCEGAGCTLWFHDVSKTNRRRWCSMAICGNRAKVAAHRARRRAV
jgi:predicted RNA-binding Zn ribbon-like protein